MTFPPEYQIEAVLAPCKVVIERQSFGLQVGVAWYHPSGGMHAVAFSASHTMEEIADQITRSRHEYTARACWAKVTPPRWRWTLLFRPRLRKALKAREEAMREALAADKLVNEALDERQ